MLRTILRNTWYKRDNKNFNASKKQKSTMQGRSLSDICDA